MSLPGGAASRDLIPHIFRCFVTLSWSLFIQTISIIRWHGWSPQGGRQLLNTASCRSKVKPLQLTLTLDGRIEEGIDIPLPETEEQKTEQNTHYIYPSLKVQSALLVRFSRLDKSLAELARTLETSWPSAARLEDPHHWSSLRQLNRVAEIFGNRLVLSFEPNRKALKR